ncbi:hypothetical protein, partial [Gordonia hydrophobica]|uniref:hypothetical protein n=1 Tax=Gordonia hydrophobica TaxID=40516 RepID=UPI001471A1BC
HPAGHRGLRPEGCDPALVITDEGHPQTLGQDGDIEPAVLDMHFVRQWHAVLALAGAMWLDAPSGVVGETG